MATPPFPPVRPRTATRGWKDAELASCTVTHKKLPEHVIQERVDAMLIAEEGRRERFAAARKAKEDEERALAGSNVKRVSAAYAEAPLPT